MKQFYFALTAIVLSISDILPQPGPAYYPITANNAKVLYGIVPLRWKNPQGATENDIYISYDSAKVEQLDPTVKYIKQTPLIDSISYNVASTICRYFWRVVEKNASGNSPGPVWSFLVKGDAYVNQMDFDDFEFGLSRWTISTNQYNKWVLDNKSNYQLPDLAYNKVLAVKNNQQGVQDIATASFKIYPPEHFYTVELSFSSDLKLSGTDSVAIQYSTDEGSTWITSFKYITSERDTNKKLTLFFNQLHTNIPSVIIRFKADLRDISSSWAIDRFAAMIWLGALSPSSFYLYNAVGNEDHTVSLTAGIASIGTPDFYLFRKNGLPTDPGQYSLIKSYHEFIGITILVDSTATDSVYTYCGGWPDYMVSNEVTAYLNGVTPVELVSFNAIASGDEVYLSWHTATETNNQGFHIEKSFNKNMWEEIAFIPGAGTTVSANDYSYTDKPGSSKVIYYRLRQQDFDGTVSYSKTEEVSLTPNGFYVSQNYPNPFNPQTTILINVTVEGTVNISLFNPAGELVRIVMDEVKQPGYYKILIDGSSLSSGVYFVKVKTSTGSSTKKIMLMK